MQDKWSFRNTVSIAAAEQVYARIYSSANALRDVSLMHSCVHMPRTLRS